MSDYPKIRFTFDQIAEKNICLEFLRMGWPIHPSLKHLIDCPNEELVKIKISDFINEYYQKNFDELSTNFSQTAEDWSRVEKSYYEKVDSLLNNYPWPQGDYKAVASVLYCFPRYIEEKWFAFPVNGQFYSLMVIAHEMLHFIVYDYMEKKFGLQPSECFNQDNKFWQFTENLNALIEDEPIWEIFMHGEKANIKPECRELYFQMKTIWEENKNVDNLIEKIFII